MKKEEKLNFLANAKGANQMYRFYFDYCPQYNYYYVLDYSDKLMLGTEEFDFTLDGFQIRKISDLKKVEARDGLYSEMNKEAGLLDSLEKPNIDLTSWQTVFESLMPLNKFLVFEDKDYFYLGYVTKVEKSYMLFTMVDDNGKWGENIKVPYSEITCLTFGDRYSTRWQEYLTKHNMLPN